MRTQRHISERGSVLVMALVFTAALLILGGALSTYTLNENLIAHKQEEETRLYYITESGIEAGVAALSRFFYYDWPISGSIDGGSYNVRIVQSPGLPESDPYYEKVPHPITPDQRLVISEGNLNGKSMVMAVIVEPGDDLFSKALMVSKKLTLEDSSVDGNVHFNEMLHISKTNTICGELTFYRDATMHWEDNPCLIVDNPDNPPPVYYYQKDALPEEMRTAKKINIPPINFEAFKGEVELTIYSGKTWGTFPYVPPVYEKAVKRVEINGSLTIEPKNNETFNFNYPDGLLIVNGDLKVKKGGAVNLGGVIVVDGDIQIDGSVNRDVENPEDNRLLLIARGKIQIGKTVLEELPEEILMGGRLLLFTEQGEVSIDGSDMRKLGKNFHVYGTIIADHIHLLNCNLHYVPNVFDDVKEKFGVEGVVVKEWIKPWRPH